MPGEFVLRVDTPLAPDQAWARVWDLGRHTEVIPLTRVALDPPAAELRAGAGITARTALGPLALDDTMRVDEWRPPADDTAGRAVVAKTGRAIGGHIEVTFGPVPDGGTRITWRQQLELPWLPSPLAWLERGAAVLAAPGYRRVLRALLA